MRQDAAKPDDDEKESHDKDCEAVDVVDDTVLVDEDDFLHGGGVGTDRQPPKNTV